MNGSSGSMKEKKYETQWYEAPGCKKNVGLYVLENTYPDSEADLILLCLHDPLAFSNPKHGLWCSSVRRGPAQGLDILLAPISTSHFLMFAGSSRTHDPARKEVFVRDSDDCMGQVDI